MPRKCIKVNSKTTLAALEKKAKKFSGRIVGLRKVGPKTFSITVKLRKRKQ